MSSVSELENQLEGTKAHIERRKMALRLKNNRDFKKLILEEFCIQECARYVHTAGDPNISQASRDDALAVAMAAGHLRRYLHAVDMLGKRAESEAHSIEEALEEARADGEDENEVLQVEGDEA